MYRASRRTFIAGCIGAGLALLLPAGVAAQDTVQASARLTGLASQIPSGSERLAPLWQSDIQLFRPHSAKSIITMQKRLVGDLSRFVQGGFEGGNRPVSGSGTTTSTTPITSMGGPAAPVPAPTPTPGLAQGALA